MEARRDGLLVFMSRIMPSLYYEEDQDRRSNLWYSPKKYSLRVIRLGEMHIENLMYRIRTEFTPTEFTTHPKML